MFDSQFCSQDDVLSVLDCGAHVALSMSMVTSDEVPSVVEASVSVENASSKSACEDSGVQCPEMSHPTLNCHDVRPKLRSMKREQLVTELRKWDPNFLDNEGLTTEVLKATLTRFYADNPIGGGPSEKMPAVSKMSKTDLLNLCRCRGILCEAREHIGELRLKVQKDFRKRMEAPATPQDTVLFGKMKGYSYDEVLDNKSYASWVVNTAAESNNSSPDLMRLATFLREKGVYPTEERSGTADTHNCVSGVQCPVATAADSKSPTMPTVSKPKFARGARAAEGEGAGQQDCAQQSVQSRTADHTQVVGRCHGRRLAVHRDGADDGHDEAAQPGDDEPQRLLDRGREEEGCSAQREQLRQDGRRGVEHTGGTERRGLLRATGPFDGDVLSPANDAVQYYGGMASSYPLLVAWKEHVLREKG